MGFDKPPYTVRCVDEIPSLHIRYSMKIEPMHPFDIQHALEHLPGWGHEHDALVKTLKFANFREALAFMLKAGFEADALNHHPEWTNSYNRVVIRLTTHDAGDKVTSKDMELAMRIEALLPH